MDEENRMTIVSLKELCDVLIEELAALGGEQMLFSHMKRSVAKAAQAGDLAALQATWKDLRVWSRGLTPQQRQVVGDKVRLRCGVDLVEEDAVAGTDLPLDDPGGRLESGS
jgi:hypothetical protein